MKKRAPDQQDSGYPPEVRALLAASSGDAEATAWSAFLESYSRLILHVARKSCVDRDAAMDRYAFVLEQLRRDDYARIRSYEVDDRARFTTWLAVVVRRLCTDFHRRRYGRYASSDGEDKSGTPASRARDSHGPVDARRDSRRRLVDLVGAAVDIDRLADHRGDPERQLRLSELQVALAQALAGLEARDRLLLALRFEDGHSARVIAENMDYPSQFHVYRRVNRVLGQLRANLEARGIEGPTP